MPSDSSLPNTIATYFDLSEIRGLCLDLGIDHENFSKVKIDRARDLVGYCERRNRTPELEQRIKELRPYIGLNVQNIVKDFVPSKNPKLQGLNSLLIQLRNYSEKVYEWKELHNYLDGIINIFGQYLAQTERFAKTAESKNIEMLNISWQPVALQIEKLLHWSANDIKHIGIPLQVLENGDLIGESWAVDLFEFQQMRENFLKEYPSEDFVDGNFFVKAILKIPQQNMQKRNWKILWRRLLDHTRAFDNSLKKHLFLVDKELRKSAEDLYRLSRESLWSNEA